MPKNKFNTLPDLTCIRANLTKAIRDCDTVQIGGGGFSGGELVSLLLAVDLAIKELTTED